MCAPNASCGDSDYHHLTDVSSLACVSVYDTACTPSTYERWATNDSQRFLFLDTWQIARIIVSGREKHSLG